MQPGIETYMLVCVCARTHTQSRPNDTRHCRMDNNVCLSPIGGCSSLLTLRDSTYRVVLSACTFAPARRHTTHIHVRARTRSPTHPSPTEEEEPPHKCQGPAAEHFLSSISVNKRCRVQWRRFESCWLRNKCPIRDPRNTRARSWSLCFSCARGKGWLYATPLTSFLRSCAQTTSKPTTLTLSIPVDEEQWFQTEYVSHTKVFV